MFKQYKEVEFVSSGGEPREVDVTIMGDLAGTFEYFGYDIDIAMSAVWLYINELNERAFPDKRKPSEQRTSKEIPRMITIWDKGQPHEVPNPDWVANAVMGQIVKGVNDKIELSRALKGGK